MWRFFNSRNPDCFIFPASNKGGLPPSGPEKTAAATTAPETPLAPAKTKPTSDAAPKRKVRDPQDRLERMTDSQRAAVQELQRRALAYYADNPPQSMGIPQQWNTLLVGPTGCGKTSIVETLADMLNATCVKCSHGSWIPAGAYEGHTPTLTSIAQALARSERVVVFIDELDKFFGGQALSNWHSSVLNELWLLLDKTPVLKREHLAGATTARSVEELAEFFQRRVFIVSAGTWQEVFTKKPTVGFSTGRDSDPVHDILHNGTLPPEVRRRFHYRVLRLAYPSRDEIQRIIESDQWLRGRLKFLRETPDCDALCREVQEVGMTALTTYKTDHILRAGAGMPPIRAKS